LLGAAAGTLDHPSWRSRSSVPIKGFVAPEELRWNQLAGRASLQIGAEVLAVGEFFFIMPNLCFRDQKRPMAAFDVNTWLNIRIPAANSRRYLTRNTLLL